MKVLTCTSPGNFEYGEKSQPALTSGRAIVKIKRIGICGTDLHAYEGVQPFFEYPRILGHELSGELTEITNAPGFEIGEPVSIIPYYNCGICIACRNGKTNCCVQLKVAGIHIDGGMVEFLSVPGSALVHGNGLSLDELALIEPLSIGAHGIQRAEIKPGEQVLVIGAGPIGLGTMEFARIAGARVIAMDVNEQRLQFCANKLNIPITVNAKAADCLEQLMDITNGEMPTVVIDATGNLNAINGAFRYIAHGGRYVLVGLQRDEVRFSHPEFHKREATVMSSRNATRDDFMQVLSAIKSGAVRAETYITHRVPFDRVKDEFESWLNPATGVIKAMVTMEN